MIDLHQTNIRKCNNCFAMKPMSEFHKRASQCKSCRKALMKEWLNSHENYAKNQYGLWLNFMHNGIFNILGSECCFCGEKTKEFLTVDHINNDRKRERRQHPHVWKNDLIKKKVGLSNYRILCRNCNEARHRLDPVNLTKKKPIFGELRQCKLCMLEKDVSYFYSRKYSRDKYRKECSSCRRFKDMMTTVNCYELLGGKCKCCGVSEPCKLNVDHLNNDGAVRRKAGERAGTFLYRKILNNELNISDFQLLCANCNYSKIIHGKFCFHKLKENEICLT